MGITQRIWSLGLILGLLGLVLASAGEAAQFNWQQFKGTQLRVLLNKHAWQVAIEPHLKEFETLTGMKLVVEVYPEDQFRAKTTVELASGSGSIDAFMTMPGQEGVKYLRAGWYQPVDEYLQDASITAPDYNWNDFLEVGRSAMTVEGRIIGPPVVLDTNQIMYRKDVLQKYGVNAPKTLDELEAAAKTLNGKPMTDDGQPGFGFITRGKRAAATSIFAGFLHAMGGTWLAANREPSFNSDEGVKAFDLFGRLLRLYGPPGSENNHWYETSSIMSQGKAAIYIEIDSISAFVEDSEKSKVKGKMGYAMFPKGPNGKPGTMTLAWGLGIPRNSKNPKAAWLFLQWATNRDQVLALQSGRGVQGGRDSVWKDPKARAKMNPELAEALLQGLRVGNSNWNPPIVAVSEVRDAIGAAIVTSIQGGDVRAAANKAAAETKRIIAETEKK